MSTLVQTEQNKTIDDDIIIDYLKNHPAFFKKHPSLLETLEVSQGITGATSLLERQVAVLRTKNQSLNSQLDSLINAARSNEQIMNKLHHLTLELFRADSLDMLLSTSQDVLRNDFNTEFVSFKLLHDMEGNLPSLHFVKRNDPDMKSINALLSDSQPICGMCSTEQLSFLFDENSSHIKSVALIPLQGNKNTGLLALGSIDEARFQKTMGTVFLKNLGELIATAISEYIEH